MWTHTKKSLNLLSPSLQSHFPFCHVTEVAQARERANKNAKMCDYIIFTVNSKRVSSWDPQVQALAGQSERERNRKRRNEMCTSKSADVQRYIFLVFDRIGLRVRKWCFSEQASEKRREREMNEKYAKHFKSIFSHSGFCECELNYHDSIRYPEWWGAPEHVYEKREKETSIREEFIKS